MDHHPGAPAIRKLIKAGEVVRTMFDERDLAEISSPDFRGERLIVCGNRILAEQRRRKQPELLASTEEDLIPIVTATQRAQEPLRGGRRHRSARGQAFRHHHHR